MTRINKILFPTDFSECAEHAFSQAAHLASLFDAELHVFNIRVLRKNEHPSMRAFLDEEAEEIYQQNVSRSEKLRRSPFLDEDRIIVLEPGTTGTSACDAILNYASDAEIDLIVMGTHGRRGPRRFLLGSTAACVVRQATCPVVTLRFDADPMDSDEKPHLLVPVDFSNHAEDAVRYANTLAGMWGGEITLLHVIEEMVLPAVYGIEPVALQPMTALSDNTRSELQYLGDRLIDEGIPFRTEVLIGPTPVVISEYAAEKESDMIVISTHGLTGLKRVLMGSITEAVVRSAPCAVWTIKSFGTKQSESVPSAKEETIQNA